MLKLIRAEMTTGESGSYWACWLSITQNQDTWMLKANAPTTVAYDGLQAHFEAFEAELWQVAQQEGYQDDLFERTQEKALLRALAPVMLAEINVLRARAGLPERTPQQLIAAIKSKL